MTLDLFNLNIFRDEEKRAVRKTKKEQIVDFHIPDIFTERVIQIQSPTKLKKYVYILMTYFKLMD